MKRRHFLFGAGALAVGGWWLRPDNRGAAHSAYFQSLNDTLKQHGPGRPLMLIDRQRLIANCQTLVGLLPSTLRSKLGPSVSPTNAGPAVQRALRQIVGPSSRVQSLKGVFMVGLTKAFKYAAAKVSKALRAT